MSSQSQEELHFALFPFMAQGHMIPMVDIAKMLAQHGVIITIFTTPINFKRFATTFDRASASSYNQIRIVQLTFPTLEIESSENCENLDMLSSSTPPSNFISAAQLLKDEAEKIFQDLKPKPNCIISDMNLPFTSKISLKFGVPRISFNGFSTFSTVCLQHIQSYRIFENHIIGSESGTFVVPGLPDRVEFTSKTWPGAGVDLLDMNERIMDAEKLSYGLIVNSFEELETGYVELLKKEIGENKVWWVGPVSLSNKDHLDMIERGNKSSTDETEILNWLNLQRSFSVIYVCFGSICTILTSQLIELGLGLEASSKPFIWVIKSGERSKKIDKWVVENGFEERTKNRGIVIRGWAPQVSILSHSAVGGFLTHCGWNSTLEAISVGLPMVTWPLFGDQFGNEKLVVQILKIGVGVGVDCCMRWREEEEEIEVSVTKESVATAVNMVIDGGEEGEERRKRAKKFSEIAKKAMEIGGSSYLNMKKLIEDIKQLTFNEK